MLQTLTDDEQHVVESSTLSSLADFGRAPRSDRIWHLTELGLPVIRADLIRDLIESKSAEVHPRGVRIQGAYVVGHLNLSDMQLPWPLVMHRCIFEQPIDCTRSRVPHLELKVKAPAIYGERLSVMHSAVLSGSVVGVVDLTRAEIGGRLMLEGVQLEKAAGDGYSFEADGMVVGGDVDMYRLWATVGAVRIRGLRCAGRLILTDSRLSGADTDNASLIADNAVIAQSVFLDGLEAEGSVSLVSLRTEGSLLMREARLRGCDSDGDALFADGLQAETAILDDIEVVSGALHLVGATIGSEFRMNRAILRANVEGAAAIKASTLRVGADAHLDDLVILRGGIRMVGAHIGGQLLMDRLRASGHEQDGYAISLDRAEVGGDFFLDDAQLIGGALRLVGAKVRGELSLIGTHLVGLDSQGQALVLDGVEVDADVFLDETDIRGDVGFRGARVQGALRWTPILYGTSVDLRDTQCGRLADDVLGWDGAKDIRLDGFVYGNFQRARRRRPESSHSRDWSVAERLKWISRQSTYSAQAYEHLMHVYRNSGAESELRTAGMEKQKQLRKRGSAGFAGRVWNVIAGAIIGHGYRPARPAMILLVVLALSALVFNWAEARDIMVPVTSARGVAAPAATPAADNCSSDYPCFNPVLQAAGATLPLIRLPQADAWRVDASKAYGDWIQAVAVIDGIAGWVLLTRLRSI